jgi:hypothetical protein
VARKRRLEITVETHEVLVVRQREGAPRTWCSQCRERAGLVTVDQAAAAAGVSSRTIYRRVETGALHFSETTDGRLLVCLKSLLGEEP